MDWNVIGGAATFIVLLSAWIFRRRWPSSEPGPRPDIGQPPETATPITEPQMEDTGLAAYSLPLPPVNDRDSEAR